MLRILFRHETNVLTVTDYQLNNLDFFFSVCLSLLRKTDVKVLEVQGVLKSKRLVDTSLSDSTLTVPPHPGTISAGRCLTA